MTRPLIGITARRPRPETDSRIVGVPGDYIDAVVLAGGIPCLLPAVTADARELAVLDRLDGVLLSGGGDILPELYGRAQHPESCGIDPVRDRFEMALSRWAYENTVPVLGICRGIQVMNAAMDGTLLQDIPSETTSKLPHYVRSPSDAPAHVIHCERDSILADLLGTREIAVNSRHHQAVDSLGNGLRATATAPDGVVEALESTDDRPFLGVQFHPENLVRKHRDFLELFRWMIRKAGPVSS